MREPPSTIAPESADFWTHLSGVPALLRRDVNFSSYLGARVLMFAAVTGSGFFTVYALRVLRAPAADVGVFTALLLAGQMFGQLALGSIADRAGHRLVLLVGACSILLMNVLALSATSLTAFSVVFVLNGLLNAAIQVSAGNVLLEFAPTPQQSPTYIGIERTCLAPFGFALPLVGGLLIDALGYAFVFALSAAFSVACAAALLAVRDPRKARLLSFEIGGVRDSPPKPPLNRSIAIGRSRMAVTSRRVILKSRPVGAPKPGDFALVEAPVPGVGDGEILTRTIYLSLDPYMRGRISGVKSYAKGVDPGELMVGGTVGEVVESKHPAFKPGDIVQGYDGWQTHAVSKGVGARKLDPSQAPISTALGVLGMPGMTAYVGLLDIGRPKAGETVVVSAASGAVGAVVGQIAKLKGCRVVGIAGAKDKCDYVVSELGFDACVNYKTDDLGAALRAACPNGIDVYFENVGGDIAEAVLQLVNPFARIPLCGLISQYNATGAVSGPNWRALLTNRVLVQGFIVSDHLDRMPAFLADVGAWVREGRVKFREDIVDGLENAPGAFIGLLQGKNFGKMLVRVGEDWTRR